MGEIKYLIDIDGEKREIKPFALYKETEKDVNSDKKVTFKEMCELISKWFKETREIEVTGEQVFNSSPSGELWHIFVWYADAKKYFKRKRG
ncbi:TPA: hypothetical protein QCQ87_004814 [Bacillus paranthracis]|nr:hypothetical protein [Bacillus paranthracis]